MIRTQKKNKNMNSESYFNIFVLQIIYTFSDIFYITDDTKWYDYFCFIELERTVVISNLSLHCLYTYQICTYLHINKQ